MNLENFPTNETAKEMLGMVTGNGFYDNSYVAKWLFQVMGMEMADGKALLEELREQAFPSLASWGLTYHEMKFGLSGHGLSPEERREQITAHKVIRPPMSPARLERILSDLTGRNVKVQDPDRSYIFKVMIHFDHDTKSVVLEGVKVTVNRLKPSHLSYLLIVEVEPVLFLNQFDFRLDTLDIHGMFQMEEMVNRFNQFQIDTFFRNVFLTKEYLDFHAFMKNSQDFRLNGMDFFSRFYNLGKGNLLDGRALVDGSWNLGTIFDKGLRFHELEIIVFFKNYFQTTTIEDFLLQVKNENAWRMTELVLLMNFLLHQDLSQEMGIGLLVENYGNMKMDCGFELNITNPVSTFYPVKLNFAAGIENNQRNVYKETNFGFSITNSNTFDHGGLTKDSIWYLDGVFSLDGSRNLKTELIEEEI